jgi:hypothetical protein
LRSLEGKSEAVGDQLGLHLFFGPDGIFDLFGTLGHELGVGLDVTDDLVAGLNVAGVDFVQTFELLVFEE